MLRRKFSQISNFYHIHIVTGPNCTLCTIFYGIIPEWPAEAAVHAVALLARREEDLGLVLVHVVLVPRVATSYDLGRAHPLADGDLKQRLRNIQGWAKVRFPGFVKMR